MAKFLLVHGTWHTAACWRRVVELLEQRGAHAIAIDLPGRGGDARPAWRLTMGDYADAINDAAQNLGGDVHLVGHSFGGASIIAAAERRPELYNSLYFLSAYIIQSRTRMIFETIRACGPLFALKTRLNLAGGRTTFRPSAVRETFYGDCSEPVVQSAIEHLVAEPAGPLFSAFGGGFERWRALPKHVAICSEDRAISLDYLKSAARAVGPTTQCFLKSSHSPFYSQPQSVCDWLLRSAS